MIGFFASAVIHCFFTRAGFPYAVELSGTSLVTTDPAPITAFFPIRTPHRTVTLVPMDAPSSTTVFTTFQSASVCNSPETLVARGNLSLMNETLCPIKTLSFIVTPSQMKVCEEILQLLPIFAFFCISTKVPTLVLFPSHSRTRLRN